ncbi:376_t:CDS:2 [Ambispora leptoticha]|uniref:376_t:CDS:1 n=1 Tax=Ambispora leptoticha TaxID=144679 RepID=A0A9N8ZUB9_9GLOM|nr:376_t:CDS:2 [Ambispora leptoticha]
MARFLFLSSSLVAVLIGMVFEHRLEGSKTVEVLRSDSCWNGTFLMR